MCMKFCSREVRTHHLSFRTFSHELRLGFLVFMSRKKTIRRWRNRNRLPKFVLWIYFMQLWHVLCSPSARVCLFLLWKSWTPVAAHSTVHPIMVHFILCSDVVVLCNKKPSVMTFETPVVWMLGLLYGREPRLRVRRPAPCCVLTSPQTPTESSVLVLPADSFSFFSRQMTLLSSNFGQY